MQISIESVITRAKRRLGLMDTTLADSELEALIHECARHFDAVNSYVVTCATVDVDCDKAPLPDNCSEVLCIQPVSQTECTDCTGCSCSCGTYYFINRNVLTNFCGLGGRGCYGGNWFDVQGGYIVLPSSSNVTSLKIYYRGLNTDENGIMILDDFQERGLSAYAAYQYATSGQNWRNYSPQQMALWQKESTAQINKIRGKAMQDDHRQHKSIFASIAQALVVNPWNVYNLNP